MGFTTDSSTTKFDEHNKVNQKEIHYIAKKLAEFRSTVIIVETVPGYDKQLHAEYNNYLNNPDMFFKSPSEIELGWLCEIKRILGIDHKMGYNYNIGNEIENSIDLIWHDKYYDNPLKYYSKVNVNQDNLI